MRTILDHKCRLCRSEGIKLYLKGARCFSPKCPFEKKGETKPGMHGTKRAKKPTDYGIQLRAKQKAKRLYGIQETQFKNYFLKAKKMKGLLGENLMTLVESRLDSVLYNAGFCLSRNHAKELVSHRHVLLNDKVVGINSYSVQVGDVITLKEKISQKLGDTLKISDKDFKSPEWLDVNKSKYSAKVIALPTVDPSQIGIDVNLIIEYYSR